jgi:uncharacterized protein YecT (DUF1311 family)
MLRSAILVLACTTSFAYAQDELERNCNPDYGLVDGSCLDQAEPDRELLDLYEWVWSRSGYEQRTLLERAQGAWLEYREATCDLMSARNYGISAEAHAKCLEFKARERTAELGLVSRIASMEEGCEGSPTTAPRETWLR